MAYWAKIDNRLWFSVDAVHTMFLTVTHGFFAIYSQTMFGPTDAQRGFGSPASKLSTRRLVSNLKISHQAVCVESAVSRLWLHRKQREFVIRSALGYL